MRPIRHATTATVLLTAVLFVGDRSTSAQATREEFSATLSNISNVGGVGLSPVTIRIHRWTTDEEHEKLMNVLRKNGQEAFLRELVRQEPVGSIAQPTSLKYDFFYARQQAAPEGGRQIFMITDRPMGVAERLNAAQSRDYPFTVMQIALDKNGRGQGSISQLAQLRLIDNYLGIENLATAPMKLADVRKIK